MFPIFPYSFLAVFKPLLVDYRGYHGMYIYIYIYTTQYIGDYSNPVGESLLTNQYNGMIEGF